MANKKIYWEILILEEHLEYSEYIAEYDFNINKFPLKKIISEAIKNRLTRHQDFFNIIGWKIQYKKYTINNGIINVLEKNEKVIKKENFIKYIDFKPEKYYVLRFEKKFKVKKNEKLIEMVYEETDIPNFKTLSELKKSSYYPKINKINMKKQRIKEIELFIDTYNYLDKLIIKKSKKTILSIQL